MKFRRLAGTLATAAVLLGLAASHSIATGPGGWNHLGDSGTAGKPSLNAAVYALNADRPGMLYVGGPFTAAGGVAGADRIAGWNGSAWSAVSSPSSQIANGAVNAIAYDSATGHVFAGGTFTNAGGNAEADFLAMWDGTSWAPFCNSTNPPVPPITATVFALQIIGRTLYVAGSFADGAGIVSADRLLACNLDTGAASSTVIDEAHEFSGAVLALTADSNGNLYAGGGFINLNQEAAADNVAYLDGTGWHAMGAGGGACSCAVDGFVRSLTAIGTNVYVGTDAKDVAGVPQADHVVRWNGSAWSALGSNTAGTDGWFPTSAFLYGMANDGSNVYATGSFQNANGDPLADNVASFDGSAWHPLGSDGAGNGPWIGNGLAVAVFSGGLYAGGNFTSAGGDTQADSIACYRLGAALCGSAPAGPSASPTAPAAAKSVANSFTVLPRLTCVGACSTILFQVTFDSDGEVTAKEDFANKLAARVATASKKTKPLKPLIKKLRKAVSAGTNTLRMKLTAAGQKKLKKNGKLRIKVRFTFTPTGGTAKSHTQAFTVKLPAKKKHQ